MNKYLKHMAAAFAVTAIAGLGVVSTQDKAMAGNGDLLAAGIAGAFVGALIAPRYVAPAPVYVYPEPVYVQPQAYYPAPVYAYPEPVYVQPAPVYERRAYRPRPYRHTQPQRAYQAPVKRGPKVVTYEDTIGQTAGIEPGSPGWVDYCRSKFRSFRTSDGTYLGYDGQRHLCVVR